jgi:hypothetical protein
VADDKGLVFPVLVRGLGEVSVADLKDVFSECGETAHVKISGGGKAIVSFASRDAGTHTHARTHTYTHTHTHTHTHTTHARTHTHTHTHSHTLTHTHTHTHTHT